MRYFLQRWLSCCWPGRGTDDIIADSAGPGRSRPALVDLTRSDLNSPSPKKKKARKDDVINIDDDDDDSDDDASSGWPTIIPPTINNGFVVQAVPSLEQQRQIKEDCMKEMEELPGYGSDKGHCDFLKDFINNIPPGLNLHEGGALCDTPDDLGGATLIGKGGYKFRDNARGKPFQEVATVRNSLLYASGLPPMLMPSGGPINNILFANINVECDPDWKEDGTFNCKPGTAAQAKHMASKLSIVAKANYLMGGMTVYIGLGGTTTALQKVARELDPRYFALIAGISAHASNYAYPRRGYRDEKGNYTVRAQTMKCSKMIEAQSTAIKEVYAKHLADLNNNVPDNLSPHQPWKDSPFDVLADDESMMFIRNDWDSLDPRQWTAEHERVMGARKRSVISTYVRKSPEELKQARSKAGTAAWLKFQKDNIGLSAEMMMLKKMFPGADVLMMTDEELDLLMRDRGKKGASARNAKYTAEEKGEQIAAGLAKSKKTRDEALKATGEYVEWKCVHTVKGVKCPKTWLESKSTYDERFPTMNSTVTMSNMPKPKDGSNWPKCKNQGSSPSVCDKDSIRKADKHWNVTYVSNGETRVLFGPNPLFDGKPRATKKPIASWFHSKKKKH